MNNITVHLDQPKTPHLSLPHLSFLFKTTSYDKTLVRSEAEFGKSIRQHQWELFVFLNFLFKLN